MKLTLDEILKATGGRSVSGSGQKIVIGISTDSRTVKKGDLFFALKGPHHNGHDHIQEAFQKGAVATVVEKRIRGGSGIQIIVKDTLRALGDLAQFWRMQFSVSVIAVTGSNGKTTTKDLIANLLETRFRVLRTEGNLNNLIGLPLTLFRLNESHDIVVLEMGMNHPGEIDRLAEISRPVVGVITVIARAHLEGLGTLVGIAAAKGELLKWIPQDGLAVLNADDSSTPFLEKYLCSPVATFGQSRHASMRLLSSELDDLKGIRFSVGFPREETFRMTVLGRHNIFNALAAMTVARHFGIGVKPMKQTLLRFHTAYKRMERQIFPRGIDLINDCYNANPDSVKASLAFLKEAAGRRRRVAILGDMLELGKQAVACHREVGRVAADVGVNLLYAVGSHADAVVAGARRKGLKEAYAFQAIDQAVPIIAKGLQKKDLVLVKGSRGMKMENLSQQLKEKMVH